MTETTDRLAAAEAELQAARQEAAARAQREAVDRTERARVAWQAVIDEYDHEQLRADVVAKGEALAQAAGESGLTRALVEYLAASLRETHRYAEAQTALANGAVLQEGRRLLGNEVATDAGGRAMPAIEQAVSRLLGMAVAQAAKDLITAEDKARVDARRAAIGEAPPVSDEEREARWIESREASRRARARKTPGYIFPEDMSPEQRRQWLTNASPRKDR